MASRVLRDAEGLRTELARWQGLSARADDLLAAVELLAVEDDPDLTAEVERDTAGLRADLERERTALLFAGEYDDHGAILTINAGAGGTEATDWAAILSRMYLRWAERHRFATAIVDATEGEETGYRSVTIEVDGRAAYGWLSAEKGVHRLVRISPFDSQNRRHTTFALVEVLPLVEDDEADIELDPDELRIETYRSQGAGGQNVQKTETAVRATHLPTGIVAQSQNERSQQQNKDMALRVLRARLVDRRLA